MSEKKEILRRFEEVNWGQTMKDLQICDFSLYYVLRAFENRKGLSGQGEHVQIHFRRHPLCAENYWREAEQG